MLTREFYHKYFHGFSLFSLFFRDVLAQRFKGVTTKAVGPTRRLVLQAWIIMDYQ